MCADARQRDSCHRCGRLQGPEAALAAGAAKEPLEAPRTLDAVRLGLALDTSGGLAGAMLSEVEASLRSQVPERARWGCSMHADENLAAGRGQAVRDGGIPAQPGANKRCACWGMVW